MARVTYKGFNLPDGAEIPDVPADLRKVADGVADVHSPKEWYRVHSVAVANGTAGTWYDLFSPGSFTIRNDLGGLVQCWHNGRYVPWGASNAAGSVSNQVLFWWGGTTKYTLAGMPWPFYTGAGAPGALVIPAVFTYGSFILPPNAGDVTVQAQGRHDIQAGWTGCNVEYTHDRIHVLITPFGRRDPMEPA